MLEFSARPVRRTIAVAGRDDEVAARIAQDLSALGWTRAARPDEPAGCLLAVADGYDGHALQSAAQDFAARLPHDHGGIAIYVCRRGAAAADRFAQAELLAATQRLAATLAPRLRVNSISWGSGGEADLCRTVRFILAVPSVTGQMIALGGPIAADSGKSAGP